MHIFFTGKERFLCLPNSTLNQTGVTLGQGAYGDVVEVEYKGKCYAAKKYRMSEAVNNLGAFSREHEILARIRHPNIVPYYGICKLASDKSTVIVMERMDKNLNIFLRDELKFDEKCQILHDIAKGLHHLHSQDPAIIHRDLTAGNVLLNRNGDAKISDFGNSRIVDLHGTPELLTTTPGTPDYMPPEAESEAYNDKLDVFSYGHLAIHIIIARRPSKLLSSTYSVNGILAARNEVQRRHKYLKEASKALDRGEQHPLYLTIVKCLHNEPHDRPSCKDIISNGITSGIFK